jgi:hypothetical protein
MTTGRVGKRGSTASRILEQAWEGLRKVIPGLPSAVLLPMDADGRRRKWGHFAPSTWRVRGPRHAHEVAISPALFSTPEELLATMLHEAVHALLYETDRSGRHIGGVSADGYYHRHEFRDACVKLGLGCWYAHGRYGWTRTGWPSEGVPARYAGVVKVLAKLPLGGGLGRRRRVEVRPTPPAGRVRLQCACAPVRAIYVARSQVERGVILCTVWQTAFQASRSLAANAA